VVAIAVGAATSLVGSGATLAILAVRESPSVEPPADTDSSIGKCLQAQRVLYQASRAEAAEACLAQLDDNGRDRFVRTWTNYETVPGSW
jgi:hypothetical protein